MKKSIKLVAAAVVYLGVCYGIGQYRVSQKNTVEADTAEAPSESETTQNTGWEQLSFEGAAATDDTPWNITAGTFEMDDEGECILLTPNTAVELSDVERVSELSFSYEIHPWVSESSDGAGLILWCLDEKDNILFEDSIVVDSEAQWQEYTLNLSEIENTSKVKIVCNNGENDDDVCDWVVLKAAQEDTDAASTENKTDVQDEATADFKLKDRIGLPGSTLPFQIVDDQKTPVISAGQEGEWDSVDVLNPSVVWWNDAYYNYYSGYDGTAWRTGLAISEDGYNWSKYEGNPVFGIEDVTVEHNGYIAANGSAVIYNDKLYYYYQISTPEGISEIGLAVSEDGYQFDDLGIVLAVGSSGGGKFDMG
jgi:hypothetical protein